MLIYVLNNETFHTCMTLTFESVIKAIVLILSGAFSSLTFKVGTIHSEYATKIISRLN